VLARCRASNNGGDSNPSGHLLVFILPTCTDPARRRNWHRPLPSLLSHLAGGIIAWRPQATRRTIDTGLRRSGCITHNRLFADAIDRRRVLYDGLREPMLRPCQAHSPRVCTLSPATRGLKTERIVNFYNGSTLYPPSLRPSPRNGDSPVRYDHVLLNDTLETSLLRESATTGSVPTAYFLERQIKQWSSEASTKPTPNTTTYGLRIARRPRSYDPGNQSPSTHVGHHGHRLAIQARTRTAGLRRKIASWDIAFKKTENLSEAYVRR